MILAAVGMLQAAVSGFSPQAESVLEILRGRIAAGAAGEEAYGAFLDLLAEGDAESCEAWWDRPEFASPAGSGWQGMRFGEILSALVEVCPEGRAEEPEEPGVKGVKGARAVLSASQAVQPRRDRTQAPDLRGAGGWSQGAWRLTLQDYRPRQRYLRLGPERLAFHAGHIQPALTRTRLGFVAGARFYTDRSGGSGAQGAAGALFSPLRALDGLGVSAAAGGWSMEAAGTWNRLTARGGETGDGTSGDAVRRDALAYFAGFAHGKTGRRDEGGWAPDFRFQAAHLRSEPGSETPAAISLAGARLAGALPGGAQGWLGAAASLPSAAPAAAAAGGAPAYLPAGAYLETGLASLPDAAPDPGPSPRAQSEWRLEARQASADWANPLQSPRGIVRDTLAGEWIVRGGGEGGLSSRSGFPLAAAGAWSAGLLGRMGADWSLEHGLLAQSGSLGVSQAWDRGQERWSLESGASLGWYRRGLTGTAGASGAGARDGTESGETGGLGQGLAWSRGPWTAKASFTWKGGDYSGGRPAPLALEWSRREGMRGRAKGSGDAPPGSWTARLYTGDIRKPWSYLRAEARQTWKTGRRLKVEHEIRLPWTPEGLAADMGYQLRLETAL